MFLVALTATANLPVVISEIGDRSVEPGITAIDLAPYFGLEGVDSTSAEIVQFDTDFGSYNVLLDRVAAPQTVENFLAYVDAGRYDGIIIHRSVPGFVIQGGGWRWAVPPGRVSQFDSIPLEYNLPNARGRIAMARSTLPDSATSEFFFNLVDNTDTLKPSESNDGYAAFGNVMGTGMTVVDAIALLPVYNTGQAGLSELPLQNFLFGSVEKENLVAIHSVRRASVTPQENGLAVLEYFASSSNPLAVGAIIDGGSVKLSVPTGGSGSAEITIQAIDTNGNEATSSFQVTVTPAASAPSSKLANISTRALVQAGENALIPGFSIAGSTPQTVLIRAAGPSLETLGVSGVLEDPQIELKQGDTEIASNDDWSSSGDVDEIRATAATVGAFALDEGSKDAALLATLNPGPYTVIANGKGGSDGVALVEVYAVDSGGAGTSRLVNTSTRAFVGTGDAVAIPGITVTPEGSRTYLVRAVGPTLEGFGVTGALADPIMRVYRAGDETPIAVNDNWSDDPNAQQVEAAAANAGAFGLDSGSLDAAMLLHLEPGNYTVVASGSGGGTGVALVEVYEVTLP